jgi:formate C-acetyltransferase
MTNNIKRLSKDALNGVDKFLYGKAALKNEDELKSPIAIANGLKRFFESVPVKQYQGEKLFGRLRYNGCEYPSDFYRRFGHRNLNKYWSGLCFYSPSKLFYWGWTHMVLDFDFILKNGLKGYINLINSRPEKNELHKAMEMVLNSIDELSRRYSEICTDNKLSDVLRKVPMNPAETFYEAVQSVWFIFQLCPDSLGRIDQYLYPFYKRDTENGTLSYEDAAELLEELFVKVFETQMDNVGLPISGHNHLVVGGYLADGTDGFNELSKLILECIADLPTFRPQASFRYTKYTTADTMKFITELNAKCQWIVFVNDEPRLPGMVDAGIDYNDAVNYTVVGCNEWCLPSGARIDLAHINLLHSIEDLIYNDKDFLSAKSFDDVFSLFKKHLKLDMFAIAEEYSNYSKMGTKDINVLNSALSVSCIESGKSFTDKGAKYYGMTMSFNSISNAADSLSVIKQFVFDEKIFTLAQLYEMLKSDYCGFENERQLILNKGRFFGNDDDYADDMAKSIVDAIYEIKGEIKSDDINTVIVGSFVGATHPNIVFGKMTKATPDGRHSGDAFTMGITQSEGKDKNGLTALLNSIAKLDYRKFCGCIVSNIKMDKSMTDSDEKLTKLSQMYHTFLQNGGMQLQINYLSQEELIEAQKKPEEYQNLVVRVTGYSGYFTRFDTDLQNDIIRRTVKQM